jgi:hypothetical protein
MSCQLVLRAHDAPTGVRREIRKRFDCFYKRRMRDASSADSTCVESRAPTLLLLRQPVQRHIRRREQIAKTVCVPYQLFVKLCFARLGIGRLVDCVERGRDAPRHHFEVEFLAAGNGAALERLSDSSHQRRHVGSPRSQFPRDRQFALLRLVHDGGDYHRMSSTSRTGENTRRIAAAAILSLGLFGICRQQMAISGSGW